MMIIRLRTWYKLHKWLSIFTGVLLLMWVITAMVMTKPSLVSAPEPATPRQVTGYADITMSPAMATAIIAEQTGRDIRPKWVGLRQILDRPAYQIQTSGNQSYLVDTVTAEPFQITEALARDIALDAYTAGGTLVASELLTANRIDYPYGPVPVYRFVFDDAYNTYVHVSPASGEILATTTGSRIRAVLGSMHTFDGLRIVIKNHTIITALLWVAAIFTGLAALIGYYLALPRRRQSSRRRSTSDQDSSQ